MRYRVSVLITTYLFALAITLMSQATIPRFKGDGNPQHDGQPAWCQNYDARGYMHNCKCKGMITKEGKEREQCKDMLPGEKKGGGESPTCSDFCRKESCRCMDPCES